MINEKTLKQTRELNELYYKLIPHSKNYTGLRIKEIIAREIPMTIELHSDEIHENIEHLKKLCERMNILWEELESVNAPGVLKIYMILSDHLLHEEYKQASQSKELLEEFNS